MQHIVGRVAASRSRSRPCRAELRHFAQRKGAPPPPRARPHRPLESWPHGARLRVQMAAAGRGSPSWQPPPPPKGRVSSPTAAAKEVGPASLGCCHAPCVVDKSAPSGPLVGLVVVLLIAHTPGWTEGPKEGSREGDSRPRGGAAVRLGALRLDEDCPGRSIAPSCALRPISTPATRAPPCCGSGRRLLRRRDVGRETRDLAVVRWLGALRLDEDCPGRPTAPSCALRGVLFFSRTRRAAAI